MVKFGRVEAKDFTINIIGIEVLLTSNNQSPTSMLNFHDQVDVEWFEDETTCELKVQR